MAKKIILKDRLTRETTYPETVPSCVLIDGDTTLKDWMEKKDVAPYPKENEIVYTTTDGEIVDITDWIVKSNIYYKDKGFGVITIVDSRVGTVPGFINKTNLKSIILPKEILDINSFNGCINLERIDMPGGVSITSFQSCKKLKQITLNEGITSIPNYCFYGCEALTNIKIPSTVTSIGNNAFNGCASLTSIKIPETVKSISTGGMFEGCRSLTSVELPSSVVSFDNSMFRFCNSITRIELPSGVTNIGSWAFQDCYNLSTIILPASLNTIGKEATWGYGTVKPLYIDSSASFIANFPNPIRLETLILRSNKVVEDVDTYVSTFTLEEGQPLPVGATLLPKPKAAPMVTADGGIMPLVNLDTYIGTPNNWLKIYVPANLLKAYQERYPTLTRHFHPITGDDIYALKDETTKEIEDSINFALEWAEFD